MGAFYGSIQVRHEDRKAVIAAVEKVAGEAGIKCFVGPALKGWIGIYPENNGQDDKIGAAVARELGGIVLHMLVHDSDVFAYWLWRDGKLADSYWSTPGYFGEEDEAEQQKMVGNPEEFSAVIGPRSLLLGKVLDREEAAGAFEDERLEKFAKVMGISNAMTAYEYLTEEDSYGVTGRRKFVHVPRQAVANDREKKREVRNQIKQERLQLERDGLLLLRDERKLVPSRGCAAGEGFVVAWPDYRSQTVAIEFHESPWKVARPLGLETPPHINGVVSDAKHKRVAMAVGVGVHVWDIIDGNWKIVARIPEKDLVVGLTISADGSIVAHASREAIVVTRVDDGETLLKIAQQTHGGLALHPSGEWIAASGNTLGLISIASEPHWRDLFIGGRQQPPPGLGAALKSQLAKLDIDKLNSRFEAEFEKMQSGTGHLAKGALAGGLSAEQIAKAQEIARKSFETMRAGILALKEGRLPAAPPMAKEQVMCAGFSRDGQWLWCGTEAGLRIYRWESVPRSSGATMPPPSWAYFHPGKESDILSRGIHAIVEEVDAPGIVFGGPSGRLYRFDLETGEARELVKLPGYAVITGLSMSDDGSVLGVSGNWAPQFPAMGKDQRWTWDIWSYPRLRRMKI